MLSDLIKVKQKMNALRKCDYDRVVACMNTYGIGKSIVKFFLALNSFGMTKKEVLYLTYALRDSGRIYVTDEVIFDKHSSGGVGDPSSLVIVPLVASMGYHIIKMGGRSLGYTNGNADRLKSIPNMKTNLTDDEINKALLETNACFIAHSDEICPADKVLYDVREYCGIEDDINLMAASIACKKLASGAKVVLVDIKYGEAALVHTYRQAKRLAKLLKYIFNSAKVKSVILITDTHRLIGDGIGNALEVVDALDVLQGKKCLLRNLSIEYALMMIKEGGLKMNEKTTREVLQTNLDNGSAYRKFLDIVKVQGGDVDAVSKNRIFNPYRSANFVAEKSGYVTRINSLMLGELVRRMCEDSHDDNLGIVIRAKVGEKINRGDTIVTFYFKDKEDLEKYRKAIVSCISVTKKKINSGMVIKKVIK